LIPGILDKQLLFKDECGKKKDRPVGIVGRVKLVVGRGGRAG
jgi:hypothetical protein